VRVDLEPALIAAARAYVEAELGQEYAKAVRSRGDQLAGGGLVEARLSGEDVDAEVREKGELFKVRLTLPLFGGVSTTRCSCLKNVTASGEPRCAHVLATHRALAEQLTAEADGLARAADDEALFSAMDEFMLGDVDPLALSADGAAAADGEAIRIVWRIDDQLDVAPYLQTRLGLGAMAERGAGWGRGRRLGWEEFISMPELWASQADHLAAARVKPVRLGGRDDFAVDVFGLLEDLEGHPLVFWADGEEGERALDIVCGKVGLAVRPQGEGIVVASHINAAVPERQWIFAGKGYVTRAEAPRRLYFARANRATTDFLTRLERSSKPVPMEKKERLLGYLVRLEQRLAVAVADSLVDPASHPASDQLHVRLTPMQPSGLKVELLCRPSPTGSYFPVGIGPETVLDVTDPERPRNVERSFEREIDAARDCAEALGLDRMPCLHGHLWLLRSDDAALDLVSALATYAEQRAVIVEWPKYAQKAYEAAPPLEAQSFHLTVGEGRDWFDVKGVVDVGGQLVELSELIQAIKRKLRYVQLKDGRWARVTKLFEERLAKLAGLLDQDGDKLRLPVASIAALDAWDPAQEQVEIKAASDAWWRAYRHFKHARTASVALPDGFGATLRPYQQTGFEWLARLAAWGMGGILADDMGLGKTVQTLAVLQRLAGNGPSLVIAPTSVGPNWAKEARRFAPGLRPILYRETDRGSIVAQLGPGDLLIASYGLVQRDIEQLHAVHWNALVLDEAQAVKNSQTKTSQCVRRLAADWRLALTGTPIENNLGELWSIFRVVSPGMLGGWEAFKKSFAIPIERLRLEGARQALASRLEPFVLRRLKEDYLPELPAKTEIDVAVELSEEERRLYDAVRLSSLQSLDEKKKKAEAKGEEVDQRLAVLAALTKLRQIACHAQLFDPDWKEGSAKLSAFVDTCRALKANGHRALVFSQFTSHLRLLGDALAAMGARYLYLDGSVTAKRRGELVDAFQGGDGDFFLISVKAGGTGLTLTAADYVLHMDPWWNPAVEDQATDRAHRMGQTKPLTVYRFVAARTVEEKILELHATKRELVERLLAGGPTAEALSEQELIGLLR
jgi:superfamily II DNA or RNA helicase